MTLLLFIEQFLNGMQFGVFLFLISAGLTLVLGIMNVVNLAHGSLYMLGAYFASTFFGLTDSLIVALILTLTEAGALLLESLARSNDQQLAGAIIFMLTASIIALNFITDIMLAIFDPRIRHGIMGSA